MTYIYQMILDANYLSKILTEFLDHGQNCGTKKCWMPCVSKLLERRTSLALIWLGWDYVPSNWIGRMVIYDTLATLWLAFT